ncbi:MAG: oligosaccharide flippase family protein [Clostridia bacterium]|nr:oligosaccharide flippase family protein [Clostridia bacterium]
MRNAKLLMLNTLILTVSGFLMRTVGVAFNVYLTNHIGAAGIGLFELIMAVYGLAVTFAGAGVRLGATRLVTDALGLSRADPSGAILTCIRYGLAAGCGVALLLFYSSPLIAQYWIADTKAAASLKILAVSLPFTAVSAALNGYFTARKTLLKYTGIQLLEQLVKVLATVLALRRLMNGDIGLACACVSFGISLSETVSCALSLAVCRMDHRKFKGFVKAPCGLRALLPIALPDAVGSGMRSVLLTVEHLLIPVGFRKSGQSAEQAMNLYGSIHGMALPIVLYPAAVLYALSGLLVPELADCRNKGRQTQIDFTVRFCLRLTVLFSFGCAAFLFFFAGDVSRSVYADDAPAFFIRLLSLLMPVMYADTMVDGMLKGLNEQLASMRYNILDSSLCVALVYVLLPKYAVKGYIFILFFSEIMNFSLSFHRLTTACTVRVHPFSDLGKPLLAAAGSMSLLRGAKVFFGVGTLTQKSSLLLLILPGLALFGAAAWGLGCLKEDEKQKLKGLLRT